jgi:hypothetical protein
MLAAFGKHPGWDDHIDDIGLETPRLVAFKRSLYFDGIAGNIDGGRWDQLSESQRLPGFGHTFLQVLGGDVIVGRLWASRDGKGRARYPMVVCAECSGVSIPWAAEQVLGLLPELETQCKAAESAKQVLDSMAAMSRRMDDLASAAGRGAAGVPTWLASNDVLAELAKRVPPVENQQGFSRLIYKTDRDLRAYHLGSPPQKTTPVPQHIRVPACDEAPERSLVLWLAMLLRVLAPTTPLLLLRPVAEPWVDVLVGTPQTQQFYCMLSSREAIPLSTEIPYTFDRSVVERARNLVGSGMEGPDAMESLLNAPLTAGVPPTGMKGPVRLWGKIASALGGRS